MGIDDFVVLDRGNDLGGTWRDNSYPGASCDVPSNLYSFSFALNPDWSRAFSSQGEIWDYLRRLRRPLRRRGARCASAGPWTRRAGTTRRARWLVRTTGGEEYGAPVLIWATGSLSEPSIPDFPGLDDFRGKVFHSARWEHGFDLAGKRVCVVGTGASAVQFVPQIAPVVEHLYLHQRTPPFVVPRRDRAVSGLRKLAYRKAPLLQRLSRLRIYAMFEALLSVFVGSRGTAQGRRAQGRPRPPGQAGARRGLAPEARPALRAGLQAPPALRRLLPVAHPSQRRGGGVTGGVVHGARGRGPGRHRPPGRRGDHGDGLRGGRAALRRAHRGPGRPPAVRALEGERRRGLRRLDRRRLPQPLPDDRAQLDAGPQLHDLHDRVAHQLHRQRTGLPAASRRARRRGQAGGAAALQRAPAGPSGPLGLGRGRRAAAGTSTTGAATRRCGRTTPGSSAG